MTQEENVPATELIVVMGATGSGKSSFINSLVGNEHMPVGHGLKSCTSNIQTLPFKMDGRTGCLIDTPGFDDTNLSDTEVLKKISDWLELTYVNNLRITGIIYLRDITEQRMKGSALKNFVMFQKLCGTDSLKNVLLVTTKWDTMEKAIAVEREKELLDDYLAPMIAMGAHTARHDKSPQSAASIVRQLLGNPAVVLDIQRQLVDEKKPLGQTAAGEAVNAELSRYRAEVSAELEEGRKTAAAASDTMKRLLEEQNNRFQEELARIDREKKQLETGEEMRQQQISELQLKLDRAAKSEGKTTQAYIMEFINSLTPMVAPIMLAAWAETRNESKKAELQQAEIKKPEPEIIYVEKPIYIQRNTTSLLDFIFGLPSL